MASLSRSSFESVNCESSYLSKITIISSPSACTKPKHASLSRRFFLNLTLNASTFFLSPKLLIAISSISLKKNLILFEDAKGRIANFLIELANEQDLKQNGYQYVFLPFSLKVLSSFVGLKRQSASTAFNELIKDDIIRKITPHEFLIIDHEKLESYTN